MGRVTAGLKVNILFELQDGPIGGGNQFLKAVRDYFREETVYEDDSDKADVILFNSHQRISEVAKIASVKSQK